MRKRPESSGAELFTGSLYIRTHVVHDASPIPEAESTLVPRDVPFKRSELIRGEFVIGNVGQVTQTYNMWAESR